MIHQFLTSPLAAITAVLARIGPVPQQTWNPTCGKGLKYFEEQLIKTFALRIMNGAILSLLVGALMIAQAHAEKVQGRKWYRPFGMQVYNGASNLYPSLSTAADAAMHMMECQSGVTCTVTSDQETYNVSDKWWYWERFFTWYNPSLGHDVPQMAWGDALWECPGDFQNSGFSVDRFTGICTRPDLQECNVGSGSSGGFGGSSRSGGMAGGGGALGTCSVGNPIQIVSGAKIQREVDYIGPGGLQFARDYRSNRKGWAHDFLITGIDLGSASDDAARSALLSNLSCLPGVGNVSGLPHCFQRVNASFGAGANAPANDFIVQRGNGRLLEFGTATDLNPAADINDRVTKLTDAAGQTIGWSVYNGSSEATEIFDLSGRVQRIVARDGQMQTLTYSDSATPATIAPWAGLLIGVADSFGRQLTFTYDSQGRMATMRDPAGQTYTYAYDEPSSIVLTDSSPVGNLTSVTYPDQTKRIYWYNEQDKTSATNLPYALTGITDENGVRFATFKYKASGQAISTEYAGGANKYGVDSSSYSAIDPLGTVRTYLFQNIMGVLRPTGQRQPAGAGSNAAGTVISYDANGNIATTMDFNSILTYYTNDLSRNLEIKRVEAANTGQARTISTNWHPTYRLPLKIAEPKRLTTFTYDPSGNVLSKTIQATTDATGAAGFSAAVTGLPRTWSYTYNALGQVLTATDPNNGVTTNTYDDQGNLASVTNAAGHTTTLSNYDANGRVGRIVDPNGLTTELQYSSRGWLISKDVGGEGTTYTYDGVGQLKTLTQPDGSTISYTYDDAHRLTDLADSLGNAIHYTLDAMGNRTGEQVKDPSGTLARQTTRAYDALNRLQNITGGM